MARGCAESAADFACHSLLYRPLLENKVFLRLSLSLANGRSCCQADQDARWCWDVDSNAMRTRRRRDDTSEHGASQ